VPILVAISFVMIDTYASNRRKRGGFFQSLRAALINPVIIASIAGLSFSLAAGLLGFGDNETSPSLPVIVKEALGICEIILKNVGTIGLSLALIAVGGKIRFRSIRKNVGPMSLAVTGKLIILPLMTLYTMRLLFPSADKDVTGAAVLLMTMPTAVTVAVIAAKFKLEEEFVSSVLAVSMLGGVVMIPVWLYVVL
jgi:predicted permease